MSQIRDDIKWLELDRLPDGTKGAARTDRIIEVLAQVALAPRRTAFKRRVEHIEDGERSLSIPAWITEIGHDRPFVIIEVEED